MIATISAARRRRNAGFTLIELLVVITVLGILAGIVVFAVRGAGENSTRNAISADERIIRTALETYCARKGHYPKMPDPMGKLVAEKFLSSRSEYHKLETGNGLVAGSCPNSPTGYKLTVEHPGDVTPGPGEWIESGDLIGSAVPGADVFALTLQDGKILHLGFDVAQVFDPSLVGGKGAWTPTTFPKPPGTVWPVAIALDGQPSLECLSCGKVLVYQMQFHLRYPAEDWYIYDPMTGSWTSAGRPRNYKTYGPSLVQLKGTDCGSNCGKVLVVGGGYDPIEDSPEVARSADLFDPKTNTWTETAPLPADKFPGDVNRPLVIGLPNGKALLLDPQPPGSEVPAHVPTAQIFEPAANGETGGWRDAGNNGDGFSRHPYGGPEVAALLHDGRVLLATGGGESADEALAELYDPIADSWSRTTSCGCIGTGGPAVTMGDGRVLVAGNFRESTENYATTGYIYNPAAGGKWTRTSDLVKPRRQTVVARLLDGRVLMAGGRGPPNGDDLVSTELYVPG